jgi:hypothetical protein
MRVGYLRKLIVDVLREHDLHSECAVNLLLGTCAQESGMGEFRRQIGCIPGSGAMGIFQIERPTFTYLVRRYKSKYPILKNIWFTDLEEDDISSILVARLKYLSIPEELPSNPNDVNSMAQYWKKYFNTPLGCGTIQQFVANYHKYIVDDRDGKKNV